MAPKPDNDNFEDHRTSRYLNDLTIPGWQIPQILEEHEYYAVDGRYLADIIEEDAA